MARSIVTKYGMSSLGARVYNVNKEAFSKEYSEITDMEIDNEVNKIINECAEKTRELVRTYKEQITSVAEKLLDKETIDILDVIQLIGERPYKLPESINAYIEETKARRIREEKEKEEKERREKEEKEKKEREEKEEKENPTNKDNDNTDENNQANNKDESKETEVEKEESKEINSTTTKFSLLKQRINTLI